MQKDFHYYCIFVLANLARFRKDEAGILAYCSQYVDDSQDSRQINVSGYKYDTVRTAQMDYNFFKWNVHKKIFFPFHFLPENPLGQRKFSYVTKAGSPFANALLDEAIEDRTPLRLYRIRVALHTFADSFAHEHFSGRNHIENDVRSLRRYKNGKWVTCKNILDNVMDILKARVGHIQAGTYPDYSYEKWQYVNYKKRVMPAKANYEYFLNAAGIILKKLALANEVKGIEKIWNSHAPRILELFSMRGDGSKNDLDIRCKNWVKAYPELFLRTGGEDFYYDPDAWRQT